MLGLLADLPAMQQVQHATTVSKQIGYVESV